MWRYGTSLLWAVRWLAVARAIGVGAAVAAGAAGHPRISLAVIGLMLAPSLYFLFWPGVCARRHGTQAIWWTPAPPRWLARQLPAPVPLGPAVWEVHAQDARRWRAPTPRAAARAYRQTYADELIALLQHRPDTVAVVSSGFNRLTPAERAAIQAAGGTVWDGPLWPRLLRRYPPWLMRCTQRRMFGAVVSTTDRRDPAVWVTWAVPARYAAAKGG